MKRKLKIIAGLCLFLFICRGVFAFGGKDGGGNQVNRRGEQLSFSELYVHYDPLRGTTEVTFFNVPTAYKKIENDKKTSLFESYFFTDRFSLVSETTRTENKVLVYTCTLQARNSMFHRESISALLSNILRREVVVEDTEIAPPNKYMISITFTYDDFMFFPAGNSVGIYYNEDIRKILYSYDIARAPIEFRLGYRG
jgi:hypothetical protein